MRFYLLEESEKIHDVASLSELWKDGTIDGLTLVKEINNDGTDVGTEWKQIAIDEHLRPLLMSMADDDEEEEEEAQVEAEELKEAVEKQEQKRAHLSFEDQWQTVVTEDNKTYYYNSLSMETAWAIKNPFTDESLKTPEEQEAKREEWRETVKKLPPLWALCYKSDGSSFFIHTVTKMSQNEFPTVGGGAGLEEELLDSKKRKIVEAAFNNEEVEDSDEDMAGVGEDGEEGGAAAAAAGASAAGTTGPPKKALTEEEREKKRLKNKKTELRKKAKSYVYIEGLPKDITEKEIVDFCQKCGKVKEDVLTGNPSVRLYRDEAGELKGDGLVAYLKAASAQNALKILDGADIRPGVPLKVSPAKFEVNPESLKPKEPVKDVKKQEEIKRLIRARIKKQERGLSWAEGAIDDGSHIRIVIMKPMFTVEEMEADPSLKAEMEADIRKECSKFGVVEKVTVFENNPEGAVAVKFKDVTEGEVCIARMNGRFFAKRQITAEFWDGFTNYKVEKEGHEEDDEEKRLEAFAQFLEKDE